MTAVLHAVVLWCVASVPAAAVFCTVITQAKRRSHR